MSTAFYWLVFALAAVILLVAVPVAAWLERRQDARERARYARLQRTEQARRRIRLGLGGVR